MKQYLYLLLFYYLLYFWFAHKYNYKVTVIGGETGAGKTMLAVSIALKDYIKKGYPVFSTFTVLGAENLPYNFYDYNYPKNSLLIIDETQVGFDSGEYSALQKSGVRKKLKRFLSMHRHNKLDIFFITQQPEEVDVIIRRYSKAYYHCMFSLLRRKIILNNKKLDQVIFPYFQFYQSWKNVKTYQQYLERANIEYKPKNYGVKYRFKFIPKKVFNSYNTDQIDSETYSLPDVDRVKHTDLNSTINVSL
jgi:hypothetical protein